MNKELSITKVRNPFNKRQGREIFPLVYQDGFTVADIFRECNIPLENAQHFNIVINSHVCNDLGRVLCPGDSVLVVAKMQFGGGDSGGDAGKSIVGTVAMVAVMVGAMALAPGIGGWMAMNMSMGLMSTTWTAIAAGAMVMGGSLIVSSLLPPPTPELALPAPGLGTGGSAEYEGSPAYGFGGVGQSSYIPGLPHPILYGKYMTSGQVVNRWIELGQGDYQNLKIVVAMSVGICKTPVQSADQILLNGSLWLNRAVIYNFATTKGGQDQEVLGFDTNFDKLHQYRQVRAKIEDKEILIMRGNSLPFTDESPHGWTWTNNSVDLDPVVKKFGAGSMLTNNVADYLELIEAPGDNFKLKDYDVTITFQCRVTDVGNSNIFFTNFNTNYYWWMIDACSASTTPVTRGKKNSVRWYFCRDGIGGRYVDGEDYDITVNTWHFVRLIKKGFTFYLYIDEEFKGSKENVEADVAVLDYAPTGYIRMFQNPGAGWPASMCFMGNLDDFVMLKGEAVFPPSSSPPTSEYSQIAGHLATTQGKVHEIVSHIEFPAGLYEVNASGQLIDRDCDVAYKYKKVVEDDTKWLLRQGSFDFTSGSSEPAVGDVLEGQTSGAKGVLAAGIELSGAGTWALGTAVGTMVLKAVEGTFDTGEDVDNLTTNEINILTTHVTATNLQHFERVTAAQRLPVRREFKIEDLEEALYDHRVIRISLIDYETKYMSDFYWTGFDEVFHVALAYPGLSLFALNIQASDQLRVMNPSISCLWDRGIMSVPDWFPLHRDYTDYIKADPNSRFSVLDWRIDFASLSRNEEAYIYKDMGEDCFDGDFTCYVDCGFIEGDADSILIFWGLANEINDAYDIYVGSGPELLIYFYNFGTTNYLYLAEIFGVSGQYFNSWDGVEPNTKYYFTIKRDESIGPHGTLTCEIYSDEARTILLDTLSLTLHGKEDFRYLYAAQSWNSGSAVAGSCFSESLRFVREVESSNPAWACYDMLTNREYGERRDPLSIIEESWLEWVDWCDGIVSRIQNFLYFSKLKALQDYMGFTEFDPGSDIVKIENKITFTALPRNVSSYLYYDFTANYFGSDFEHRFKINIPDEGSGATFIVAQWALANALNDIYTIKNGGGSCFYVYAKWISSSLWQILLGESDSGSTYVISYSLMEYGKDYWIRVVRDESVGANGTLYIYCYSDEEMTKEVFPVKSIALHTSKKDFRYLYGISSWNTGGAATANGTIENLDISPVNVESNKISFIDLTTNEDTYSYMDYGGGYFNENFEHKLTAKLIEGKHDTARVYFWALTNEVGDWKGLDDGSYNMLGLAIYQGAVNAIFSLYECDGGTIYNDNSLAINVGTLYYLTIERDENVGVYGTLYCRIYTDSDRATLFDTLTLTLHNKVDFRYLFGVLSFNIGDNDALSGECSDMMVSHKRITCNGIFDAQTSVVAALEKFQQLGRATILRIGQKIDVVLEKPFDREGELFSSGNVIEGTSELEFIRREGRPDAINIEFRNTSKNFSKDKVMIKCSGYDTLNRTPRIESIFLWGCTDEDGARRQGLLRMQMNERLNRMTSHESDVDAIGCQVGDVIRKVHDSDEATFGGRLMKQDGMNNFYVKLDKEIEIEVDGEEKHHKIWVRHENNTLVERYIRGPWDTETDEIYIGALEDFGEEYIEVDPGSNVTVDGSDITFTGLPNNVDSYVYRDFGVDHFNENFEHQIDGAKFISYSGSGYIRTFIWALTNEIDDWKGLVDGSKNSIGIELHRVTGASLYRIVLWENDGGSTYTNHCGIAAGIPYYLTIKRDESVGAFGTLYCYIYSDEARTTLLDTLTLTLHTSKKDYRYLFGLLSYNAASASNMTGEVKNININGLSGDQTEFDIFAIGKTEEYAVTKYRLLTLGRTSDTMFRLAALEYDEMVYVNSEYDGFI